ncbi:hypothetical protein ACXHXG_17785 [Rhizobium sp. LEGMi198b]|uniref:hypothetical protein n=1 Tax=Rhizobium sp. CB3171 TaxID=3039157 RepID=UPI0024B19AAB|nr:hypothetical protein [Rhizobium sp. CB3171]WFU01624.1 hypothetical protein QA648_16050 [Rhizobium sp. CB3171]
MIQVSATLPANFIAFEYATGDPDWWHDIAEGLSEVIVKNGFIDVIDRPGMVVDLNPEKARRYLAEDDRDFFARFFGPIRAVKPGLRYKIAASAFCIRGDFQPFSVSPKQLCCG